MTIARWLALSCLLLFFATPDRSAAASVANIQIETLNFESGLRVVLARTPLFPGREPRAYVGMYVGYGANDESLVGRAHLLEHLVANGKPATEIPAVPVGAKTYVSNAVTKANGTVFIRTVSPDALEASIYSRLARIGKVEIDAALFAKEKDRVIQELERVRANPRFGAYKALDAGLRVRPPSVDAEINAVRAATLGSVLAEKDVAYQPSRSVLVVAGDFDLRHGEEIVRKAANDLGLVRRQSSARSALRPAAFKSAPDQTIAQNNPALSRGGSAFANRSMTRGDDPAFLIADQLLMGGRDIVEGEPSIARSDKSPLGKALGSLLGATELWDGKEQRWGVPAAAERDPSIYAILFSLPAAMEPYKVRTAVLAALKDIHRTTTVADLRAAKEKIADFYEAWLLEGDYRILGDHLAAFALDGGKPEEVKSLPQRIRATPIGEVRRMLDRVYRRQKPIVVVTTPS